ncbi:DNA polymerase POL4, putative [Talaromyces stipitatus ATCC 10500]|uniref:DNA polymerase n=1 Tax=Talaromyces stipitatus (strain ATCC 10500 / CBS 375.48 / QM 6759 / NRRL 1006) TaxID=441959 RepID=B8LW63_TALSN|nr:DNA polymerase POL4, putative [Talaromyces stipitatus ATCC 10500]EED24091.1 DNA polymerase POL4, putative [Talaromyces stipitatus ATCC 10500]
MSINKDDFFRDLDSLGYASDDSQHESDLTSLMRHTNTAPAPATELSPGPQMSTISEYQRTHSTISSTLATTKSTAGSQRLAKKQIEGATKRAAVSLQSEQPKCKKRRAPSAHVVPESEQIFKNLKFFFVPNNDISPARRLRIQRSQDYGAAWAQTWSTDITHVIVDKGLDYKEVLKVLTPEQLFADIAIVNQDYVSDCLVFKSILLVTQARFRVDGTPKTSGTDKPAHAMASIKPTGSLQEKQPQRHGRRSVTPSRSEDTRIDQMTPVAIQQEADAASSSQSDQRKPDALDKLILKVKAAGDLPLDEADDEAALDVTIECGSEAESSQKATANPDSKVPTWQKNFACMEKHDGNGLNNNPNARTIDILQKMAVYYERTADNWRTTAYRKAIAALRKQKSKICTKAEALAIPGIGQRLADKIEEIVSTDHLRRLDNINATPEDRALQLFLGVYGAGFAQASKWVAKGYRSLEDLENKAELTANQKIGVERYNDFKQRIPRAEVALHGNIIRAAVHALDPDMEAMVAGSYRRGAADCGDIDILITKSNGTIEYLRTLMIDNVVPKLMEKGFLKASLATTSRGDGPKWHGASALPGTDLWRRIDLLFVPGPEIGAALIYFTGNDIFNRSLRLLARKKGMRLNQHGLYKDVLRGPNQVKLTDGTLLEGQDEKRIFEILGVPWRPPEHRIC